MAIAFNGSTSFIDKIQGLFPGNLPSVIITVLAWTYAKGQGEGNNGAIYVTSFSQNRPNLRHNNSADTLSFVNGASVTNGIWTFPALDNQWNAVAVQYDRSLVTNDPAARVNFADVTVTETSTPVGVPGVPSTAGYTIGNTSNRLSTWDGFIGPIQVFYGPSLMSTSEMDAALMAPGAITKNLLFWNHMNMNNPLQNLSAQPMAGSGWGDLESAPAGPWSDFYYNLKRSA